MKSSAWLLSLLLVALGAAVPLSACSSNKNHEERDNSPEAIAAKAAAEMDPKEMPIGLGLEDPGSRPVNCEKLKDEANFEYAWGWDLAGAGKARATYSYDDNTPPLVVPPHNGWEPPADDFPGCDVNKAIRFKGGPFTEYGGGFGQSFCTVTNPCSNMPLPVSEQFPEDDPVVTAAAYDLSTWTGIAIWIRRGPNGQPGLRVGLTERNSSEDLNTPTTLHPERESRYCRRFRSCGCAPGLACQPSKPDLNDGYCWDPATDPPPNTTVGDNPVPVSTLACGVSRCNEPNVSFKDVPFAQGLVPGVEDAMWTKGADPLFVNRGCNAALQADGHTDFFCYNPGQDPNPPAKRERCGSPFSRPIMATLDWQLVRVPFAELRQNDDMDVAESIDLHSVKQLVFTHTTGLIDFYVGNVGFYRHR